MWLDLQFASKCPFYAFISPWHVVQIGAAERTATFQLRGLCNDFVGRRYWIELPFQPESVQDFWIVDGHLMYMEQKKSSPGFERFLVQYMLV